MNGTQPQMPQHVASVYKELVDGLRSMKAQQWTITNYAILLLAAAFAVAARGLNVPHLSSKLNFLITVTAVAGTALLLRIQYNMARSSARLDKMDDTYFTDRETSEHWGYQGGDRRNTKPDPPPPGRTLSRGVGVHYRSARCFVGRLAARVLGFVIRAQRPTRKVYLLARAARLIIK
jgi:hypothetical protein